MSCGEGTRRFPTTPRLRSVLVLERLRRLPVLGVVIVAVEEFGRDRASRTAAALAYYTLFSLAPLLFLAVGLAGIFFGGVVDDLRRELVVVLPPDSVDFVVSLVEDADAGAGLAVVIAVLLALWSGSAVFAHLQIALNDMFGVTGAVRGGFLGLLRRRVIGALGVVGVGILLVLLLAGNGVLRSLERLAPAGPGWVPSVVEIGSPVISFLVLWATFALVLRYLPAVRMPWRAVRRGAAFTGAALLVTAVAVGWFVGLFGLGGPVGAASSVAVLLYVAFLLAQVILFGAELTEAYAARLDSTLRDSTPPTDGRGRPDHRVDLG